MNVKSAQQRETGPKFERGYVLDRRLTELMRARGDTPADVARAIGTARQTVYAWRDRKTRPEAEYLIKLADYFGVSVASLLYGAAPLNYDVLVDVCARLMQHNITRKLNLSPRKFAAALAMMYDQEVRGAALADETIERLLENLAT